MKLPYKSKFSGLMFLCPHIGQVTASIFCKGSHQYELHFGQVKVAGYAINSIPFFIQDFFFDENRLTHSIAASSSYSSISKQNRSSSSGSISLYPQFGQLNVSSPVAHSYQTLWHRGQ